MGNWIPKESSLDNSPNVSKVIAANWDPRSPTNGISRTPILFVNGVKDVNKQEATPRTSGCSNNDYDPRSPTCLYNRTPLILKEKNRMDSMNDDSMDSTDSTYLLQQVPEFDYQFASATTISDVCGSPDRFTISTKSIANFTSNLPRHIIQRKQVEKINRKQYENAAMDKENQE